MAGEGRCPLRIFLAADHSAKTFALALIAFRFGANGIWIKRDLNNFLNDSNWIDLLGDFQKIFVTLDNKELVTIRDSLHRISPALNEKVELAITERSVSSDFPNLGLDLTIEADDYDFQDSRFIVKNETKFRALASPIGFVSLSFCGDLASSLHRRDLYQEFDLLRALSLNLAPKNIPLFVTANVLTNKEVWNCGRQTLANGVVIESRVAEKNPGVFSDSKSVVVLDELLENVAEIIPRLRNCPDILVETLTLISSFLRNSPPFFSDSIAKLSASSTEEEILTVLSESMDGLRKLDKRDPSLICRAEEELFGRDDSSRFASKSGSKEERFRLKRTKLKENRRRKKEIRRLKRIMREKDNETRQSERSNSEEETTESSRKRNSSFPPDFPPAKSRRVEEQNSARIRVRSNLKKSMENDEARKVLKVALDLSFGREHMTHKEMGRLAVQVMRVYGSNKKRDTPARVDLCGLGRGSLMLEQLESKFKGFHECLLGKSDLNPIELYSSLGLAFNLVVLTPDSANVLTEVSSSKVYILGGLVDESVTKNLMLTKSRAWNIESARLPIREFMDKSSAESRAGTSFSSVLTINQVFDILLRVFDTGDWKTALMENVPVRKGFVVKSS